MAVARSPSRPAGEATASSSAEHKGLVHGALYAAAHDGSASRHIHGVADCHGAEAMAGRGHGGIVLPCICPGVVSLVLAEHTVRALAPHHEYLAAVMHGPMAGARRRQGITRLPFVLRRVVPVVQVGVGVKTIDAAADDVDEVADGKRSDMVAPGRQRGALLPPVCLGVVDQMPVNRSFGLGRVPYGTADAMQQTA